MDSALDFLLSQTHHDLLTRKEEIELAKRIEAGDLGARDTLMKMNFRLVVSIAQKYSGSRVPLADRIQEGNVGLQRAAEKYDHRRGTKFSYYATFWIRSFIQRAVGNYARMVHLPINVLEDGSNLNKVREELEKTLGEPPTLSQIAAHLGISVDKIRQLRDVVDTTTASLDALVDRDRTNGDSFMSFLPDNKLERVEEITELRSRIKQYLGRLKPVEQEIIILRFGLDGEGERKLEEIGNMKGLTRERIRQIERNAIRKLVGIYNPPALLDENGKPRKFEYSHKYSPVSPDEIKNLANSYNLEDSLNLTNLWYCKLRYHHNLIDSEILTEYNRLGLNTYTKDECISTTFHRTLTFQQVRKIVHFNLSPADIQILLEGFFTPQLKPYETEDEVINMEIDFGLENLSPEERMYLELRYRGNLPIKDIRDAFSKNGFVKSADAGKKVPFGIMAMRNIAVRAYISLNSFVNVPNLGKALANYYKDGTET